MFTLFDNNMAQYKACHLRIFIMRFMLLVLCFFISSFAFATKHFLIDTDAGSDDAIAILYLLQRPDIKIHAITIVGNGEARCEPALRNIAGLLRLMRQETIPIACSNEVPLKGTHRFPSTLTDNQETFSGANVLLPKVNLKKSSQSAVGLMIKTINQSPKPITILALGPLTNIAQALQRAPQIKDHIQGIFISGGAVHGAGNIKELLPQTKNTTAEWNFYIDPLAAAKVFHENIPLVLIPLDVTNQIPIDMIFLHRMENNRRNLATDFVFFLLKRNQKWILSYNFYFWDPLAAAIASDLSIAQFKNEPLNIVVDRKDELGRTVLDPTNGRNVKIAIAVDKERFKTLLLNELNRPMTKI